MAIDDTRQSRRRSQPDRGARTRRLVHLLFLLLGVVILIDALVGERGLLAMLRAKQQHEELVAAIDHQRAENVRLREEIRRLTEDPSAIEEIARRELGLIRPGEKLFILRDLTQSMDR